MRIIRGIGVDLHVDQYRRGFPWRLLHVTVHEIKVETFQPPSFIRPFYLEFTEKAKVGCFREI
jgi:hypothetical protein